MSNSTHTQKEIEAGESAEGCIPRADTAADTDGIISEQEKKENQCIWIYMILGDDVALKSQAGNSRL